MSIHVNEIICLRVLDGNEDHYPNAKSEVTLPNNSQIAVTTSSLVASMLVCIYEYMEMWGRSVACWH